MIYWYLKFTSWLHYKRTGYPSREFLSYLRPRGGAIYGYTIIAVANDYIQGIALDQIAKHNDVTTERARQLLLKYERMKDTIL